ncbi:hypothetical protein CLAFUW4_10755 [Fulvia fulva]|uniref:DUF7587 domain-containing protein n=1 Tax=Passalora fulva TaxID=5499 RepID=A0A9Q8LGC8_PASFU|nr:uncharacterized protein CLAFUR5_05368 [Fulvia fulva]KAK4615993.1 hypothetical protein CLAFUR4_10760 [Fulvia fulva]KAK4617100.1 hypothetical protein CLAFUR0_10767 [Fulvia fulva]UJO16885.1 hypothetical protein CLAFUR5_05368 [Fulvia fulva]WPV19220.1 hypothetical protein CLAFUW4_10755 [Fulvia fulva]WPV34257.1 hypothetical protein CLAFUW7_10757 [Fulvia fulva]
MNEWQTRAVKDALRSPRYLFRVVSDNSLGTNSTALVDSLAGQEIPLRGAEDWESQHYDDFTSMDWVRADAMLQAHFRWQYRFPSAFSSWSTSLLESLIYALLKRDVWKESRILIYVLDTTKVTGPPRIYHAPSLMNAFRLTSRPRLEVSWKKAAGEYLVYGKLSKHDGFTAVKLEDLIDAGLLNLGRRYDLGRWTDEYWFRGVIRIRYTYF